MDRGDAMRKKWVDSGDVRRGRWVDRGDVRRKPHATLRDAEHYLPINSVSCEGTRNYLLGFSVIQAFHLLVEDYGKNIYEHFPKLFQGLSTLDEPYHIKIKANDYICTVYC